ncbi:hypothetical protein J7L05_05075 [bacterium]|nr:hypothetical protein [bacterium]
MTETESQHEWRIINIRNGYLVTERCVETGARQSFFSLEDTPPIDNYTDGEFTWKYLGSAQAVKFDLECAKHKKIVKLDNVVGLMLCTECDPTCNAAQLANIVGENKTWVYVALSEDPSGMSKAVTQEETRALTEYFNSRIKTPGKKILFVPDSFIKNFDTCKGEIIADMGMTEIY